MVDEMDTPDKRNDMALSLTGPLRTMSGKTDRTDLDAPSWWHGDEEAYETTAALLESLPRRR
jgi:hypothetical protein